MKSTTLLILYCLSVAFTFIILSCNKDKVPKSGNTCFNDGEYRNYYLSAGDDNSFIIKSNNILMAAGSSENNEFLTGVTTNPSFKNIMIDVSGVSAGKGYTLIIKKDGTLWVAGAGLYIPALSGITELVKIADDVADTKAMFNQETWLGWVLKKDKSLSLIDYRAGFVLKKVMDNVSKVEVGGFHALILTSDNTLWGYGSGSSGQLGVGDKDERLSKGFISPPIMIMGNVADIAGGYLHTLILKTDKTLWSVGSNGSGQLGDGTIINKTFPVKIMNNVSRIACGYAQSFAIKNDCSLWAMGNNYRGQLGDGTTTNRIFPKKIAEDVVKVSTGTSHTIILKTDSTFWATGSNKYGQLGMGSIPSISTFQKIPLSE